MHPWKTLLLAAASLTISTAAQAGSMDAQSERAARKACLAGDYAKGVSILADLFLDTKNATHIYNQGRCLEQNGRFEEALFRFQEYLRISKDLSEADKEGTRKHIADCQAQLVKRDTPVNTEPLPVIVSAPTPPPDTSSVTTGSTSTLSAPATAPSAPAKPGMPHLAGTIFAGVGGAALVAGVVLNLKANNIASTYSDRGAYTKGKESERKDYATLAWVGYGVGAACVATGAVLYLIGQKSNADSSPAMALVPALAPGAAGAMLKGSF